MPFSFGERPSLATSLSPVVRLLLAFAVGLIVAVCYCRTSSSRDPGSVFFDASHAYDRSYSLRRQWQADDFIARLNSSGPTVTNSPRGPAKAMCVGVATVDRPHSRYFRSTVGSLLDRLSDEQRRAIHLVLFIAHADPGRHPAYREGWPGLVADSLLLYDERRVDLDYVARLESERNYRVKALLDYVYLLRECHGSGAPWVAMIEDDTIASHDWYGRTLAALDQIEARSRRGERWDWLYLRLFYTEQFLGWNREEWAGYLAVSLACIVGPGLALVALRYRFPKLRRLLSNDMLLALTGLCLPACVLLYFCAGRVSMQPLTAGLHAMPRFGCCSQGLVFARHMVPRVIERLESRRLGFVDELLERWADQDDLVRWAVVPAVLQHVGRRSSKGDDYARDPHSTRSVAEKVWNFAFELSAPS